VDLVSPPLGGNSRGLFPIDEFDLDFDKQTATCPAGKTTERWCARGRHIHLRFRAGACAHCPLRAQCTTSKSGRSLNISRDYRQLRLDRARAETAEFAALYRLRGAVEATISEAVHCCGLRASRYRGRAKRALHAIFAATALNVRRMLRCEAWDGGPEPMVAAAGVATRAGALEGAGWRVWARTWPAFGKGPLRTLLDAIGSFRLQSAAVAPTRA